MTPTDGARRDLTGKSSGHSFASSRRPVVLLKCEHGVFGRQQTQRHRPYSSPGPRQVAHNSGYDNDSPPASTRHSNRELPALLGFAPTNSVVAYMLRRDITHGLLVRCVIRFDVMISTDQAANLPVTCNLRAADNDAVILLAVCDEQHDRHAHAVLDALRDALNTAGIHVLRRVMTRDVTAEGQWLDPDTGECGPTYPYTDSLLTAQRILSGDRVSPDRSDIEAEFATIEPAPPVVIGDHGQLVTTTAQEIADALDGHPISRCSPV